MSKKILIIGAVLVALTILGVWLYVFMTGSNAGSNGTFANLGVGESDQNPSTQNPEDVIITDVRVEENPAEKRLRQLTVNAVAGAVFAESGIYYVEQGTGHIRHINLVSGKETLVSGTTIPGAYAAYFSEDGSMVAITTTQDSEPKTIVASVPAFGSTGNLDGAALPLGASQINLTEQPGSVLYFMKGESGGKGYAYDIEKRTGVELFSIPLRDVHILWGETIYVYTTPTHTQTGYVYRIDTNTLNHVTPGGVGLMAFIHNNTLITTTGEEGAWFSESRSFTGNMSFYAQILVPEKCISGDASLFCAVSEIPPLFPDSWYKGVVSLSDTLWQIDNDGSSRILSDFLKESGREIDVLKIGINPIESHLYLINKNDNTLWLYRL